MALAFSLALCMHALASSTYTPSPQTEPTSEAHSSIGNAGDTDSFIAPTPLTDTTVAYPSDAPKLAHAVEVTVRLRVADDGFIEEVHLVSSNAPPEFVAAVLLQATHFQFNAARYQGSTVAVEINFTQRFEPERLAAPMHQAKSSQPLHNARLAGELVERGTRQPIAEAYVIATVESPLDGNKDIMEYRTQADGEGRFDLPLLAGNFRVRVVSMQHHVFAVSETIEANQHVQVRYLLERTDYNPFETVVLGQRERLEVARTSLRDREIRQVPGTFGDPFRVVDTMPGVGQVMSLLSYPIVRGQSPGNTGFFIDRVHIPQLYHFLGGPAVIHPEFIDRVDFHPGVFPTIFGGYTGGIVNGISRRPEADETRIDVDVDLTKSGLFVRAPAPFTDNVNVTAAGRYGYPGALLSAFQSQVFASYWDYQTRVDVGPKDNAFTAFVFGAYDEVGSKDNGVKSTALRSQFHRLHLRYEPKFSHHGLYELIVGYDQIFSDNTGFNLASWVLTPRAMLTHSFSEVIQVRGGVEGTGRIYRGDSVLADHLNSSVEANLYSAGAFVDFPIGPADEWVIVPGVRADHYRHGSTHQWGIDPRLLARYRVGSTTHGDIWLKAGAGIYRQPPRFMIPIPGLEAIALQAGLLRSYQASAGVEMPINKDITIDVQGYYQYTNPLLLDLEFNAPSGNNAPSGSIPNPTDNLVANDFSEIIPRSIGRSYGLELMVRHNPTGPLFGWLSYTLSRSERQRHGSWVAFDFDRTHMLHLVAGIRLPRNWEISGRVLAQSGRPIASDSAFNDSRLPPFVRLDFRIDKRAVWAGWLLDFYIDIINTTIAAEPLGQSQGNALPYILPTIGMRAVL